MVEKSDEYFPAEQLHELFDVDFERGRLQHRDRPRSHFNRDVDQKIFNAVYAGKEAISTKKPYGCESAVTFRGEKFRLYRSRVIWAMWHGAWPLKYIGHRNGDFHDDRSGNLREQTPSQRSAASQRLSQNSTGIRGVYLTPGGKFRASIGHERHQINLGTFDTRDEAQAAYQAKAKSLQGEFVRLADNTPPEVTPV